MHDLVETGPQTAIPLFAKLVVSHETSPRKQANVSIAPGYTNQEILDLVYEYERLPHGTKRIWLTEQGISWDRFRRWRNTVFDGVLHQGLIPRDDGFMTSPKQRRRIAKLYDQNKYEHENDRLQARVRELEATNAALGKAIGLLHQLNDQEPGKSETTEQNSS